MIRLFTIIQFILITLNIQFILIILKLCSFILWSWWWVLSPSFITILIIVFLAVLTFLAVMEFKNVV